MGFVFVLIEFRADFLAVRCKEKSFESRLYFFKLHQLQKKNDATNPFPFDVLYELCWNRFCLCDWMKVGFIISKSRPVSTVKYVYRWCTPQPFSFQAASSKMKYLNFTSFQISRKMNFVDQNKWNSSEKNSAALKLTMLKILIVSSLSFFAFLVLALRFSVWKGSGFNFKKFD